MYNIFIFVMDFDLLINVFTIYNLMKRILFFYLFHSLFHFSVSPDGERFPRARGR